MRWVPVLVVAMACGSPPSPAPSAVVNATPASVCAGQETVVELDSSGTAGHLTLVPAPPDPSEYPLTVRWSFPGFELATCATAMAPCIEGVDHTNEQLMTPSDVSSLSIRVAGDRPLHVALRVTNAKGGVGDAFATISLTLPDDTGQCPLPAAP
jgi:hypothetical protein